MEQIGVVEGEHDGTGREEGWELCQGEYEGVRRIPVAGWGKDKGRKAGEWKVG